MDHRRLSDALRDLYTPSRLAAPDEGEEAVLRTWDACPTCGNAPCECSASVGTDGVTAIDRSKVPWRVWRDVSPHATVEAGLITWP